MHVILLILFCFVSTAAHADCTPANDLVGTKSRVDWVKGGLVYDLTNDVLKTCDGTNWQTVAAGSSLTGGTSGYLGVWSGATILGLSSTSAGNQLFWDSTNHRLGIGTTAPTTKLDVIGSAKLSGNNTGNVPHACLRRSATSSSGTTLDVSCSSGEILTGGGCAHGSAIAMRFSYPNAGLTSWSCGWNSNNGDTMSAFAICCKL